MFVSYLSTGPPTSVCAGAGGSALRRGSGTLTIPLSALPSVGTELVSMPRLLQTVLQGGAFSFPPDKYPEANC